MIATTIYIACALSSTACAVLLTRGWLRTRASLLLWSSLGFAGLALNNLLLFLDKVIAPDIDLSMYRAATGLVAVAVLLGGLVWDAD